MERGGSQLCVFYDHELTPPLMAFKPAKREVILKLSQPRFYRGFFCLQFGHWELSIVQKLLQLQSFTFCPELYLAASGHNYNLFHGALISLLVCTLLSSLSDLAHLASPQGCQFLSDDLSKSSDFFIGDLVIVEFRCSLHSPDPGEPIPAQARIAVSL